MIDQTCQHLQVDARLLSFMLHKMNASQDQFFLTVPASRSKFLTVSSRRALLGTVILLAVAFAATKSAAAGSAAFCVSGSGQDSNPGTKAAPFATLALAQQALRSEEKRATGPAIVEVGQGTYALDRPLMFSPEDSGSEASPVIFAAPPLCTKLVCCRVNSVLPSAR
jgi:hypothetical protein